jgi:AraC-like DNA-binding protein
VLSTGEPKLNIVELFFNEQGVPDWFITHKLPVRDRQGRVIGLMGTAHSYAGRLGETQAPQTVERALTIIRENFRRGLTVKELANLLHVTPRQLHRKFVAAFGTSPQAFIVKLRVQAACEALQQADSQISAVAETLGFCDQSAFTQLFQKYVGLTPFKYQQRFKLNRPASSARPLD